MREVFAKSVGLVKDALVNIFGIIVLIGGFLLWGYLHQMFSFADCGEGGQPDLSIGAIIASGFGFTSCIGPAPSKAK
jgi:hypothetical protein